ncbi:alpha/beta hydrolase [Denitromonas iodatirespirans]|uniref:Alpha/beta hydrolase n=1 Tax=Denitromonas iodatirespirans TaxID=2795389 RepID=A0A944D9E8_DENI1|nr:alpha/beta hydrolase [Denitromonas iodatirespirans]MBT0962240.1 alpha/beta hydrolase [Denitromonas iodatirespirans]
MALDPKARALLDMVYRVGAPRFHELNVTQARHASEKLLFAFRPDAPPVASVTEVPIPRGDGSVLMARLYRPLQAASGQILPLLVFYHGGGWCVGDVPSYDVVCRELANGAGCAVLSVEYRLAPEHPFPAAFDDALWAPEWAIEQADLLEIDPERVALGGDSAGGNLSLAAALAWRGRAGLPPLRYLAAIYPCTEIHSTRPSRETYGEGYFLDRESLRWFFERYLPHGEGEDWRASPMRAETLTGLPPMTLVTAGCDPLTDDCLAFAERAEREGVTVRHHAYAGMVHGFFTLGGFFPQANEAVAQVAADLAEALS